MLRSLIDGNDNFKNAIIFCNRKTEVATLWRSLDRHGYSAGALHGDMDQRSRMAMLANFKEGRIALLVASDVAARGLDIPDVSHIFNFDVPVNAEDYIHRIGRTGRAGKSGSAFMIVTPQDRKGFEAIEALTGVKIEWQGEPVEWAERSRGRGRAPKGAAGKSAVARKDDTAGGRSRRPGRDTAKIEAVDGARADDSSRPVAVPHNQRAAAKSQNQRGGRPAVHADASKPGPKSGPGAKSGHGHAAKKQGTGKEPAFDDAHPFGGEDFVPAFLQRG